MQFEVLNELTLKVTTNGNELLFTKSGAFIAGESQGGKNYKFEKVLLGPQGNLGQAIFGQLSRRFTGENLPLMKVMYGGPSVTYFANEEQHVVVYQLSPGETISVESENILAFTPDCKYGVKFLAQGIISQKGLATSYLTGNGPNACVALLVDGNPVALSNMSNGNTIIVDPDAVVFWIGQGNIDPKFKMDLSWKNLIGQASGESYMFEFNQPCTVVIQPNERKSGLDVSMDSKRTGQQASRQQNMTMGGAAQQVGSTLQSAGNMLGATDNTMNNPSMNNLGGLGNIIGNLFQ